MALGRRHDNFPSLPFLAYVISEMTGGELSDLKRESPRYDEAHTFGIVMTAKGDTQ